ncbi:MAG: ROK family protein [Anaerolineae bacterium]|nr:ROK family protein [Anaerolineae bacterium]
MTAGILAIDFGGTRTRVGWYSNVLELITREESLSHTEEPINAVIDRIIQLAQKVVPDCEVPSAIGICAPGPQAYTGYIRYAHTLPTWDNIPLAQRISAAFSNAPTFMENDANLAALAEYQFGAAQGADPALYLTVSTGIGGGAIIGGQLFTGWRGLAIEPGHIKFPAKDGKIYSLEALASGTGIGRLAWEKLAASNTPSSLRQIDTVDGKAVGEAAMQGDALALEVITEAGRWLGLGLVAMVHLFNPQVIVIGGSVVNLGELIFAPARQTLAELLIDPLFNHENLLKVAALGDDVCLTGAAIHAQKMLAS